MIDAQSIARDVLESVEWDFQHNQNMNLGAHDYITSTMSDYVHEAIDRQMIYTRDIVETWAHYGYPEPEVGMSDGTVHNGIVWAVFECLRDEIDTWEIAAQFVDSHASLLMAGDIAIDDVEAALDFLIEYADSEH